MNTDFEFACFTDLDCVCVFYVSECGVCVISCLDHWSILFSIWPKLFGQIFYLKRIIKKQKSKSGIIFRLFTFLTPTGEICVFWFTLLTECIKLELTKE